MIRTLARLIVLASISPLATPASPRAGAQEAAAPEKPEAGAEKPEAGGEGRDPSGRADQGNKAAEEPGGLDPFFKPINPAQFQRLLDRAFRFDAGEMSNKPRAVEIGEPLFFDLTRPLGDLKYGNELNYLLNPSTANAPTLQVIEYEYAFADWNAAELDLSYFNARLEIITPFYQRTLGMGRRRNWIHGLQVSPDIYTNSRFVGGSAVYAFGWKPEEGSKFSTLTFLGANRMLIGGFQFPRGGPSSLRSLVPSTGTNASGSGSTATSNRDDDRTYGAWRPTFNFDLFYKLSEKTTLSMENDLFFGAGRSGEYFSFPFVTYETGKHAFFQAGGGYYHLENRDQFTFLLHINFVNPSPRRVREEKEEERRDAEARPAEADREQPGRIRRWLGRLAGDR